MSHKIHTENKAGSSPKMPLMGLAIGDGLCDPVHQIDYADFMFQTGLLDENDRDAIYILAKEAVQKIQEKEWDKASEVG